MYLCLDLSLSSTGFSKFNNKGEVTEIGKIVPQSYNDNYDRIFFITNQIASKFKDCKRLVIEDLWYSPVMKNFLGIKFLAKLAGAISYSWMKEKDNKPKWYQASNARKLVGVKGNAYKAEVQLWVLNKLNKCETSEYHNRIEELFAQFNTDSLSKRIRAIKRDNKEKRELKKQRKKIKSKLKYRMNKLSKQIEKETGFGEDLSDSILLGFAYKNDKGV